MHRNRREQAAILSILTFRLSECSYLHHHHHLSTGACEINGREIKLNTQSSIGSTRCRTANMHQILAEQTDTQLTKGTDYICKPHQTQSKQWLVLLLRSSLCHFLFLSVPPLLLVDHLFCRSLWQRLREEPLSLPTSVCHAMAMPFPSAVYSVESFISLSK